MAWPCHGHGIAMAMAWPYHGHGMVWPWPCHGMAMPWQCHGMAMAMPWHGMVMAMPWLCHGHATAMAWPYHCHAMALPFHGHAMALAIAWPCHSHAMVPDRQTRLVQNICVGVERWTLKVLLSKFTPPPGKSLLLKGTFIGFNHMTPYREDLAPPDMGLPGKPPPGSRNQQVTGQLFN